MVLIRLAALPVLLAFSPLALADVAPPRDSDDVEDTETEDDEKGCATLLAPASLLSAGLGLGLILGLRRRGD